MDDFAESVSQKFLTLFFDPVKNMDIDSHLPEVNIVQITEDLYCRRTSFLFYNASEHCSFQMFAGLNKPPGCYTNWNLY